MIIGFEELKRHRHAVAMVDGAFDPLHGGHIAYFAEAVKLGVPLLCNVACDDYVRAKHPVLLPAEQRAAIVDAIRHIALTHINRADTETVLRELRPKYYVKGRDWEGRLPAAQLSICRQHGIEIVYLDTVRDSSTRILRSLEGPRSVSEQVAAFEEFLFNQRPVPAAHYDEEYFTSEWREAGNRYTIEARRQIEGRHPVLIRDVFQPKRVLDLGCGPGALMFLLYELGIAADGVDFSPRARELAPPEIRDRIAVGSVTEPLFPDGSYDLVICREVFEHLTVLQVCQAVRNICRITSDYAYVTTRFHPAPSGLFDVTTQFDVDKTHITLMNQDFLRLLFLLEGFGRRPDLETGMDWLKKGRVLVYQKRRAAKAEPGSRD